MNPRTDSSKHECGNELEQGADAASVTCQCRGVTDCQLMTGIDPALVRIMAVWQMLPQPTRAEVESICLHPLARVSSGLPKCPADDVIYEDQVRETSAGELRAEGTQGAAR